MSLYEKYAMKKSPDFTRLVGVSYGTFQIILHRLNEQLISYKAENKLRQRGRKSSLSIENQLLLTLIYLRQYHTFLQLGEMFSISESYAQSGIILSADNCCGRWTCRCASTGGYSSTTRFSLSDRCSRTRSSGSRVETSTCFPA